MDTVDLLVGIFPRGPRNLRIMCFWTRTSHTQSPGAMHTGGGEHRATPLFASANFFPCPPGKSAYVPAPVSSLPTACQPQPKCFHLQTPVQKSGSTVFALLLVCDLPSLSSAFCVTSLALFPFFPVAENIEPSSVYPSWGVSILPTEVIHIFLLFLTATAAINAPFPTTLVGSGVYNNKLHYSSIPHV